MSDMPSKKSFFRSGLIKQDLRQHGWISIVYFICLLFTVPLGILQLASRDYVIYEDYQNYMMINTDVQVLFLFSIPIAAGLLLFRYLQNEAAVDMIHSLPIRRETLYVSHIISGLLLLIIPILLTSFVTFFVTNSIEEFQSILTLPELFSWTGLIILMTCMMFFFTVAVGMMTGMSSAQGILTYIFLFLPIAMVTMVSYNLSFLLFGYSTFFLDAKIEYLSPFFRFIGIMGETKPFSILELTIYTILTICCFFIGLGLYKVRQLEKATDVIAFPFLRPVFKYGVTFCFMIVGGSYFSAAGALNWNWIIFGYVCGAVIGYAVAEMILQKTWRIFQFRVFTGLIVYSAIFIIILFSIKNDFINYENKLPRMDQISEVYFGNKYSMQELFRNDADVYSDSKLYIQDVRNLHEYITHQKDFIESQDEEEMYKENILIAYRLNNGNLITREYNLPMQLMKDQLKPVMEAEPYKRNLPEFFRLQDKALSINIVANGPVNKNVMITDPIEMKELSEVIEKELLSQSLEDLITPTSSWGYFEFARKQPDQQHQYESYNLEWKKSYDEVTSWLDEHGYLEDARITIKDIVKAEVTKGPKKINKDMYDSEEFFKQGEQFFTITDTKVLSEALQNFTDYPDGHTYHIKFILKNRSEWYGSIPDEHVPNEISDLFR
jgi:ABC-2 type transport system permease protein